MSKRQFDAGNTANPSKKQKYNIDINLEDDVIKYNLMPSLQHVSMSKIIITLWNQADIKYQIIKLFNKFEYTSYLNIYSHFSYIGDEILEKLLQLAVPSRIREYLSKFVKPIGYEIFKWIKYQDCFVFNIDLDIYDNQNLNCIAINYIDYLAWTATGIIDYQETAKTLLAKEEKLLDNYKYNIACEYCLGDEIAIISPKVINTTLTLKCILRQRMVYFWTAHMTGDFTKLVKAVDYYNRKYSTNYSINECLFALLIKRKNMVATKYIWEKLNNEEKSRQLVPAIKNTSDSDIRCFLLSQMSKEQEKEVFQSDDAKRILLSFLDDWLWGQYFLPTIHHIWDIMSGCVYLGVLEYIKDEIGKIRVESAKYNQHKYVFKELWQYAPKHLKEYVFEYENGYYGHKIFLNLFNEKNIDIIRLILAHINDQHKKQIIFSSDGIEKCYFYLVTNQWDLFEMLIDHTLFSREDVDCFKQTLIKLKGVEIAEDLIHDKKWNKVEQFLQWGIELDDEKEEFKQKLACKDFCKDILKCILSNNNLDFTKLECFLKWCFSGDEEKVVNFKAKIPEFHFGTLICKLIAEDKYDLIEQILNFCFINDQKQISQFKQNFYPGFLKFDIQYLIIDLVKQDDELQSFRKFVYYWCSTHEEINKFKTCILHPSKQASIVFIRLLYEDMFKLADEFVNWCCNSSEVEIDKFKNQLMVDNDMRYLSARDDLRTFYETEVLKWFKPSIETITKFKEKFINGWWLQDILPALDNYVQEQQCKAKDKDIGNRL